MPVDGIPYRAWGCGPDVKSEEKSSNKWIGRPDLVKQQPGCEKMPHPKVFIDSSLSAGHIEATSHTLAPLVYKIDRRCKYRKNMGGRDKVQLAGMCLSLSFSSEKDADLLIPSCVQDTLE